MRKVTIAIVLAVIMLCMAAPALAQSQKSLWQTAQDAGTFKVWTFTADAGNFKPMLVTGGPFTIFAPTDSAFDKLPAGTMTSVIGDKLTLPYIVNNHIITGKYTTDQLVSMGSVKTLYGKRLNVTRGSDGTVMIGGARITSPNIDAKNGMIQGIDTVLMP